jgi:hypothetical protein
MAARLQRSLELPGPTPAADRFAAALSDIGARFRQLCAPVQVRRFVDAHRAWLFGVGWQVANRASGGLPGLDDYLTMRLHSAGGEPTFAMLEIANGLEVPGPEMDAPAVRALTEMAILVAALDNDRYSFRRESLRLQTDQNVFTVLMSELGCSLEHAVHEATALRDRVMCRFIELRERVCHGASTALRGYLTGLGHGIRGNAEWGQRAPRYLSLGELPDDMTAPEITWADRPATGGPDPRPAPTIGWWWDRLI